MTMRFLLHSFPVPRTVAPLAEIVEADGWDGLVLADSQNLVGDPYSELALAASVTSRLELGPYVTNPVTRHAAVTASAIATLQAESGGRALLGISRGDSSLASIGRGRATLDELGRYVDVLQSYLGGHSIETDGHESRLEWLIGLDLPKVPVDVVATGPRAISLAATRADRVTFAVGASPERIRWAIDLAREARTAAGLSLETLQAGACVVAATAPSTADARDLVRANVGIFARFTGQAAAAAGAPEGMGSDTERSVADHYDEGRHGLQSAGQTRFLPDPFIDRFAVVGAPEDCARRLSELAEMGLHHLVVVGPSRDIDHDRALSATRRFANEVLPRVREDGGPPG